MVFTGAQTTAFFTETAQVGIESTTRTQLQVEGLTNVDDLEEFEDTALTLLTASLRHPPGRVKELCQTLKVSEDSKARHPS